MRTIHKFLISLLISVVLLGVFIVLGYTGLFETVETGFYNQRILSNKAARIDTIYKSFKDYNDDNIERFTTILENPAFLRVFSLDQNAQDINERKRIVGTLEDELIGFQYIRIIRFGEETEKIEYSSNRNDIRSATSTRIIYNLWRNSEDYAEGLADKRESKSLVFNDANDSFIYKIPVTDDLGLPKGIALIYFSASGFKDYLFSLGLSSSDSLIQIFDTSGLIIDMKEEQEAVISERLGSFLENGSEQPQLISSDEENNRYYVMNRRFTDSSLFEELTVSIVIKESELELNPLLIVVLLVLLFFTVFLVSFLLLNIRQDRSVVIASRIKKFQLSFLVDYLDNKRELDWTMWEQEMRSRREQVRKEFKKGLGRFKKDEEEEIDRLIDSSWDEIITVLSKKKEEKVESQGFDLKKIEQIIQKALKNVNITVPADRVSTAPVRKATAAAPVPVEVEELSEEDLEELEDLGEPIAVEELSDEEGLEDLEDLGEPIAVEELTDEEDLEDLEDLGEPIAVEELTDEEDLEDLEDLGEPIAVEELTDEEGLEDLEDLGEPIAVEELTDEEDLEDLEDLGEPIAVEEVVEEEELEDLEDLGEPIAVEEVTEEEELEDLEDLGEPIAVEEVIEEEELEDLEDLGEPIAVEEVVEEEELEELEDLGEPVAVEEVVEEEEVPQEEYVTEEELEELLPLEEVEELPRLEEEELESIPVYAGVDEAALLEMDDVKGRTIDTLDFSGSGIDLTYSGYYSDTADLEEVSETPEISAPEIITETEEADTMVELEDLELVEKMEVLEELDELEELEELEDLEELDEFDELEELEEIEEISELEDYYEEILFSHFISEKAAQAELKESKAVKEEEAMPLADLVDSVLDIEEEVDIVQVYSDDLLPDFSDVKEVGIIEERVRESVFAAVPGGFDFDSYTSSRKDEYKALISITREINAVGGVIYSGKTGDYTVELSLGVGADLIKRLSTLLDKEGIVDIISRRNIVHIFNTEHKDLKEVILDSDRRFLKAIVFIPIVYGGKNAYLFLGFKKSVSSIEQLLKSIT